MRDPVRDLAKHINKMAEEVNKSFNQLAETVDSIHQRVSILEHITSLSDRAEKAEIKLALIRQIPVLPAPSEQEGIQGRAYTRGWQSVIAAIDEVLRQESED